MDVRTIVAGIATDGAEDPLLEPALRLAERTGADLFLVHAFSPERVFDGRGDDAETQRSRIEERLEERVAARTGRDRVFCLARPGRPDEVLAAVAAEVHADLLLLAATRRGPIAERLLGTTAQQVVRHAPAPVLVLRSPLPEDTRVLLTTDLSAHSLSAHARGVALAQALGGPGARIRTLHVTPPVYSEEGRHGAGEDDDIARGLAGLTEFLGSAPGGPPATERRVRVGDPAREIAREAGGWGAGLLVMGTHARTGAARWLLGSVAETVLHRAPCSVLVIPPAPQGAPVPAHA